MNIENLKKLSPEQLVNLAGKTGVKFHPRKKIETIIKEAQADPDAFARMILDTASQTPSLDAQVDKPKITPLMAKRLIDAAEASHNTPELIEEAITHVKERVPEFSSSYNANENTWHFSCRGAMDSGNIFIPMRKIVRIAEIVSRGRLAPRSLNQHFGDIPTPANSPHTNLVLA